MPLIFFSTPSLLLAKSSVCLINELVRAPISPLLLDICTWVEAILSICLEGNWLLSNNFWIPPMLLPEPSVGWTLKNEVGFFWALLIP